MDPRIHEGSDLLETSLEDLRTAIDTWLKREDKPRGRRLPAPASPRNRDRSTCSTTAATPRPSRRGRTFCSNEFEVIHPAFSGDEAELRQYHEENLRTCDGVVIFYGAGQRAVAAAEARRAAEERRLRTHEGDRRTWPSTSSRRRRRRRTRFRTHKALVVPQWTGLSPDALAAIRLRAEGEERDSARDRTGERLLQPVSRAFGPSSPTKTTSSSAAKRRSTSCCAGFAAPVPVGRRHVRQRQVVAGPLRTDSVALQRHHGEGRLELACRDLAAGRRSDRPPGRGARRARRARRAPTRRSPSTSRVVLEVTLRRGTRGLIESVRLAQIPADDNLLDRRRSVRGAVPLQGEPRASSTRATTPSPS